MQVNMFQEVRWEYAVPSRSAGSSYREVCGPQLTYEGAALDEAGELNKDHVPPFWGL